MRALLLALGVFGLDLAAASCGGAPNEYPDALRAEFAHGCPLTDSVCACTWDNITRAMTADEYRDAIARFRREGLMDPKLTHARTVCVERHPRSS